MKKTVLNLAQKFTMTCLVGSLSVNFAFAQSDSRMSYDESLASNEAETLKPFLQVKKVVLYEGEHIIQELDMNSEEEILETFGQMSALDQAQSLPRDGKVNKGGSIGEVIKIADDLIALGEKIYKLIEKGKPVMQTSFAPISVLPKMESGQVADIMTTTNWSLPEMRKFSVSYKNGFGMKVVTFKFTLIFVHSGKYNGKGKYITAAQIIPSTVTASWGFNVSATMKLDAIMNHGSVADPVAGAMLLLTYKVSTLVKAEENNVSFYIGGDGRVKMY
jgi:hypothetical protein